MLIISASFSLIKWFEELREAKTLTFTKKSVCVCNAQRGDPVTHTRKRAEDVCKTAELQILP